MKKIILGLAIFILFLTTKFACAGVIINEVQIGGADANDEFIELFNSDSSSVDLTDWYINKKSSTGNESILVAKSHLENKSIPANGYFLLGKENGYAGNVNPDAFWPNSYSLANNNSLILYKGDDTGEDQTSWESIENGKSIQKTSDGWIIASPTPGASNVSASSGDSNDNSSGDGSSNSNTDSSTKSKVEKKEKIIENPTMKAKILASNLAFTGEPFEVKTEVLGFQNEKIVLGKAYWNFGDGSSLE